MTDDVTGIKAEVTAAVAGLSAELLELSHGIHGDPEPAWTEHRAVAALAGLLRRHDLPAEVGVHGLPTALRADFGSAGPLVVICCEYDAMPDLGHVCGHNIIASAGVGAALALRAVADRIPFRVRVLGTPAEESGGGKVHLLEAGAFDNADAAMMVHAYSHDVAAFESLARETLRVEFHGRAAHSATAPEQGINAGAAATLVHVAVALLHQHLPAGVWVHGITRSAGTAANTIPDLAVMEYGLRGVDAATLRGTRERLMKIFEGAALATGCTWQTDDHGDRPYQEFRTHQALAEAYRANAEALGRGPFHPGRADASTDMGNVSWVVPSLHAMLGIDPGGVTPHQAGFLDAAGGPRGDRAVLDGATAMAHTVIDIAAGGVRL